MHQIKVLLLTYYWPPAGGPGVQRWLKLCKYLPQYGVQPTVITVLPEQATWPVRDLGLLQDVMPEQDVFHTPTFEPFEAYLKLTKRKQVPYSGFANEAENPSFVQKLSRFVRGNFFLPDARKGWNSYAFKQALTCAQNHSFAAVITTGPPHSTHLVGLKLQKALNLPWIADFRDPWTDIYYYNSLYPTKLAKYLDGRMEKRVLKNADAVLCSSPFLAQLLAQKVHQPKKFHFFPNGYDPGDYPASMPEVQRMHLVYAGTITKDYPLSGLIKALKKTKNVGEGWCFELYGQADAHQEQAIVGSQIAYKFRGYVPHAQITRAMCTAHILLLVIPDQKPNTGIIPGKLFEYLGSGRPILGIGPPNCNAAQIVQQTESGAFFDYNDAEGILEFLNRHQAQTNLMGDRAKTLEYSRQNLSQRLAQLISGGFQNAKE